MAQYHGLSTITDPATQRVMKLLMDRISTLEGQALTIGTVSQPLVAPLNANTKQIKGLADPTHAQDAVSLRYLQTYVESRVHATVQAAAVAAAASAPSAPGTPGGPPNPTVPPSGNPVTGALTRGFDLATATIYNSPPDIASWPVTGSISKVSILPGQGVYITCNKVSPQLASPPPAAGEWPQDPAIYPDAVGLQYTLYVGLKVAGVWAASGFIQCWVGRPGTGSSPIGAEFALNWAYDGRWGTLNGQTPPPGTTMLFMVAAGNHRGFTGTSTVRERSEVVTLPLPDANGGTYA